MHNIGIIDEDGDGEDGKDGEDSKESPQSRTDFYYVSIPENCYIVKGSRE
ncbi:MAG: hypothetical protein F6K63_21685 [Moorea sp. SIO1G6]|nr:MULTISPECIES: hypothetical protein [unclassified Moorena]NEQ11499.1 hypothetical protein [Moorena sp. SIO4E2]NES82566.1 hypothetical protein [Moorena sp. SIO2B7]NET66856.1 hypothetical protein [Moorena sp. SIO1G6]